MNSDITAVDTSLAIPLLAQTHPDHARVIDWASGRKLYLSGHAATEVYSVLTRLPGDMRLTPGQAATAIDRGFEGLLTLPEAVNSAIHHELARAMVAGGAAYDAVVALAAKANGAVLATRDRRARPTYEAVGAEVVLVAV
ncbi:MAG: PIN domain-containing protein [Bifidobacteriaceae bacterium]|nr:PIN domain-containing protein [Bifidobacteriaceae bacterium]